MSLGVGDRCSQGGESQLTATGQIIAETDRFVALAIFDEHLKANPLGECSAFDAKIALKI